MWEAALALGLMAIGIAAIGYALHRGRLATVARRRLTASAGIEDDESGLGSDSRVMRRHRWSVLLLGSAAAGTLWGFAWPWPYVLAFSLMATMVLWQVGLWLFQRRLQKIEQQLADSIDMMVAAVKSGASLQGAMASAMENTAFPWKGELQEVVGRIRYGDDPIEVLTELTERVPLETVRLLAQTLAVNWSVGGRLAQTLANVGRTIRDRLELSRRMHSMTTQARLSVISVIAVTYFIGALMWRNDPDRMGGFLQSLVGQSLVATAIVLQAVGIVWIARLSTPKF